MTTQIADPLAHLLAGGRLKALAIGREWWFYRVARLLPSGSIRLEDWEVGHPYRYAEFRDRSEADARQEMMGFAWISAAETTAARLDRLYPATCQICSHQMPRVKRGRVVPHGEWRICPQCGHDQCGLESSLKAKGGAA